MVDFLYVTDVFTFVKEKTAILRKGMSWRNIKFFTEDVRQVCVIRPNHSCDDLTPFFFFFFFNNKEIDIHGTER